MADEKTYVYLRGGDGKPHEAASFADAGDAQEYAARKRRFGGEAFVSVGTADKDTLKNRFPAPQATAPVNRGIDARLSAARAQVIDEQFLEAARSDSEAVGSDTKDALEENRKVREEEAKKAEDAIENPPAGDPFDPSTVAVAGDGTPSTTSPAEIAGESAPAETTTEPKPSTTPKTAATTKPTGGNQ
jgi:hypothetical protein